MLACFALMAGVSSAQTATNRPPLSAIRVVKLEGMVEVLRAGTANWTPAGTNDELQASDQLRTGANSVVGLIWPASSVVSFGPLTQLEVLPPETPGDQPGLNLARGVLSFFHRDKPGRIRVLTRAAVAGVEGTEFVIQVDDPDRTILSVVDGKVVLTNAQAGLLLTNSEQAIATVGQAPVRSPGFIANNVLQWSFYYPAVLDPADLTLSAAEQQALGDSLDTYRNGDLLAALAKYPAGRQPGSDAERVYHAALLLSVGQVSGAEAELGLMTGGDADAPPQRAASALRLLVSAVKHETNPPVTGPKFASEFLAASYYEQSRAAGDASLQAALDFARKATILSPESGFAWERTAELEFSFGRTAKAAEALDQSLELAPRNAEALSLQGYLLAAQNRTRDAITWFDRALALDSALGNAWLGRGLCRIHRGDAVGGREDLLIAAALEPQRASLRSYLAKAYGDAGNYPRATNELGRAESLDTNDPTAWLYSALLNQEYRRINDAIADLEKSKDRNTNRAVYRSQLLLDQDQAVRSANLAAMYRDAGMFDVATEEAGRAVSDDYGNYSAHLFLANAYDNMRDPNGVNLRYQTALATELRMANLLAPVNAGPLSTTISQQEYSPLFQHDKFGVVSSTEYLSRGAWTENGAAYGQTDTSSVDFETFYHTDPGQRTNNDLFQRQYYLGIKQQLAPQDTVYVEAQEYEGESGDQYQHYNPADASPWARNTEKQRPIAGIGYHHEWGPGVHTLAYVARIEDTYTYSNLFQPVIIDFQPGDAGPALPQNFDTIEHVVTRELYANRLTIYSGELQQFWEAAGHTTVIGSRFQYGDFRTYDYEDHSSVASGWLADPSVSQDVPSRFRHLTFYGYHQWQVAEPLQLIAGVTFDHLSYPENLETFPITDGNRTADQVSPKAGIIWTPRQDTTVRFAFTRSLGGENLDQSYQLEPAQVAGFVQSFQSIAPGAIVGPVPGARFQTLDLAWEERLPTRTYLGLSGEILTSHAEQTVGAYTIFEDDPVVFFALPTSLAEKLDYQEQTLQFTANQLLGRAWSLGLKYRLSQAVLHQDFEGVPDGIGPPNYAAEIQPRQKFEGTLQQLDGTVFYNDPRGPFGEAEAVWYGQSNQGFTPDEPGDHFWQLNAFAGYRSPRRRIEASVGLLNIANQDYQLNPLNLYNELPRARTLAVRFQLSL